MNRAVLRGANLHPLELVLGSDLTFHQLADLSRKYAGGRLRTAVNQNIVLRWVHNEDLPSLHAELIECGLAEDGVLTLTDVMTCPGADTCSLGVTSSKGLGLAIRDELIAKNGHLKSDPLVEQIRIKISGCELVRPPPFADIGFYGNACRSGERKCRRSQCSSPARDGPDARIAKHVMRSPPSASGPSASSSGAWATRRRRTVRRLGNPRRQQHLKEIAAEYAAHAQVRESHGLRRLGSQQALQPR
jgi:hypothetical protein